MSIVPAEIQDFRSSTPTVWTKGSRSEQSMNCVEVAIDDLTVWMRDSKDPSGPMLAFKPVVWNSFIGAVKSGEFDTR